MNIFRHLSGGRYSQYTFCVKIKYPEQSILFNQRCTFLWTSLMAQWVKNLPAMQETQEMWVQSLGWKDPLEDEMATHSSILAWRVPMD